MRSLRSMVPAVCVCIFLFIGLLHMTGERAIQANVSGGIIEAGSKVTPDLCKSEDIPFTTSRVESSSYEKGIEFISTVGENGMKDLCTDSAGTVTENIIKEPVHAVVTVGTYTKPLPSLSYGYDYYYDLDCEDVGYEHYVGYDDPNGLDGDGDGWACEGW